MGLSQQAFKCALALALLQVPPWTYGQKLTSFAKAPALTASDTGSISVVGYTNLSIYNVGEGPNYEGRTGNLTEDITGGNYVVIASSELNWGPFFGGGSCLSVAFNSSLNPLNLGVVRKDSFQAALNGKLCCNSEINEDYLQSISGANTPEWRNVRNLSAVVSLSDTQDYKYVMKALGNSGNSTVTYQVTVHDKSDAVCQTANGTSGGGALSPAPSPSAGASLKLPYFESYNEYPTGGNAYLFTFVNVSCVSIQVPAQANPGTTVDWRTFLMPGSAWSKWIANSTELQYPPVPSVGTCVQTSDTSDASSVGKLPPIKSALQSILTPSAAWAFPSQDCQINIDGLFPYETYILFTANNVNASTGYIRVSAKSKGSCSRVTFPSSTASSPGLSPSGLNLPIFPRGSSAGSSPAQSPIGSFADSPTTSSPQTGGLGPDLSAAQTAPAGVGSGLETRPVETSSNTGR